MPRGGMGILLQMAREAELESAMRQVIGPFADRCFSRALPCAERNLILAFGGWLNQLRNPRNCPAASESSRLGSCERARAPDSRMAGMMRAAAYMTKTR